MEEKLFLRNPKIFIDILINKIEDYPIKILKKSIQLRDYRKDSKEYFKNLNELASFRMDAYYLERFIRYVLKHILEASDHRFYFSKTKRLTERVMFGDYYKIDWEYVKEHAKDESFAKIRKALDNYTLLNTDEFSKRMLILNS